MGNNENKNNKVKKSDKKNLINYKQKIINNTNGNEMKKVQVKQQKKCQHKMKRKTLEHRSSNQKYFTGQTKRCPGTKLILFCVAYILYQHSTV